MASLAPSIAGPTAEELLRLQNDASTEFVDGQIVEKPVSIESSLIEQTVARLLGNEAAKTHSAEVFGATICYRCFPEDPNKYRRPDASVVTSQRFSGLDLTDGFLFVPPDLAVEVVSPNDLSYEVSEKVDEYLRNGFPLIWIVEPATKTVTIYRGDGTVTRLRANDEITGEKALPTFRCKVAEFFLLPANAKM